ncbi:hypothetical protein DPMN_061231 [Dreissena polymorpha]|uniref:Uncharacterized protein n=1 Tax=Dreissena polymorpha TaxID=45954 RepID=A0A9D4HGY1_DREPO|nr:hypothetical protein DPMN_061231 [Dreissena polymorpha]
MDLLVHNLLNLAIAAVAMSNIIRTLPVLVSSLARDDSKNAKLVSSTSDVHCDDCTDVDFVAVQLDLRILCADLHIAANYG